MLRLLGTYLLNMLLVWLTVAMLAKNTYFCFSPNNIPIYLII